MTSHEVRAARMVRWYPASWRSTHDTEFVTLLEDSIADRGFWPRRGAGVIWEGTRLRLIDFGQRARTPASISMSPGSIWLSISTALFLGYSLLFLSTASAAYAHGFEALTSRLSTIGGSVIIALGIIVLAVGVRTAWHRRSWRACWPLLMLGAALIGLVATNWWFSSGKGLWGWTSTTAAVAGLNPQAWSQGYSGLPSSRLCLSANLALLILAATGLIATSRRLAVSGSYQTDIATRMTGFFVLGAAVGGVWLWVVDLTGRSTSSLPIAWALTVSAISTLGAAFYRRGSAAPT